MNVQADLSHREAKSLFGALIDQDLAEPQVQVLRAHLDQCGDCRIGWTRYEKAIQEVRGLTRERAPAPLASSILRRIRRKRMGGKLIHLTQMQYRVPVEVLIPLLIAIMVAALLYFAAP